MCRWIGRQWIMPVIAAAIVVAMANSARATTNAIGASDGNGPRTTTQHGLTIFSDGKPGWKIGSKSDPQEVFYDPDQGPWIKELNLDIFNNSFAQESKRHLGGGVSKSATNNTFDATFRLRERLKITGEHEWVDWHEELRGIRFRNSTNGLIGSFSWKSAKIEVKRPGDNWFDEIEDAATIDGDRVDFRFDALPVGTKVKITKKIDYYGNGQFEDAFLKVAQYPTVPSPSTAAGGLMLLGIIALRRRERVRG